MTKVRIAEPVREQGVLEWALPEDTLPHDHRARLFWRVVETLNLEAFTRKAKAIEGRAGRRLLSTRMLLTLWLYGISIGVGSAREIARRIQTDTAFRWIVGDQKVGHSKLSEFRASHRDALDQLFTHVLATLLYRELISLDLVAQDGTRVRASASSTSFRRVDSLENCREQAKLHVKAVLADADDPEATARENRARIAAARDYERRVDAAIETVHELLASGRENARASTTDADARLMKMGDGGFRPAYNVQFATAGSPLGGARTIVGVRVTNDGTDMGSVKPMLDDIERRTSKLPTVLLADGNHAQLDCITDATRRGVIPVIAMQERSKNRGAMKGDTPEVAAWRERMQCDEGKELYRARPGLCELPNAHLKTRLGVARLLVRGLEKVMCMTLLAALSANILAHASALLG